MTLYETFRKSAEKEQEKIAIIVDDLKWSYSFRELLELVDKTAGCLYQYGVRPGMRVGILTTGTVEEASVFFSLNKIGAVARYLDFLKDTDYLVHSIEVSKLEILTEYDGMAEDTSEAFITLADGSVWFNTHDLGYISETGYVYITGRTTRVAIRFDYKLPLDDIEEKVKSYNFVQNAALIITDTSGSFEKITSFVVLADTYRGEKSEEQVLEKINEGNCLSFNEKIDEVCIMDRIPVLSSGKVDYALLNDQYQQMKADD
jgi:acyl-coenzyme A synthetase/AMP-(fatty) acid ligase